MRTPIVLALLALAACSSSSTPTGPATTPTGNGSHSATPASVAGAWADTTDAAGDGISLGLSQAGDSLHGAEYWYLRLGNPGHQGWYYQGRDSVWGAVSGDTVFLGVRTPGDTDAFGQPVPIEYDTLIAHQQDTLAATPQDSVAWSDPYLFTRTAALWQPDTATTAPPPAGPTAITLTGTWLSPATNPPDPGGCGLTGQVTLVLTADSATGVITGTESYAMCNQYESTSQYTLPVRGESTIPCDSAACTVTLVSDSTPNGPGCPTPDGAPCTSNPGWSLTGTSPDTLTVASMTNGFPAGTFLGGPIPPTLVRQSTPSAARARSRALRRVPSGFVPPRGRS